MTKLPTPISPTKYTVTHELIQCDQQFTHYFVKITERIFLFAY